MPAPLLAVAGLTTRFFTGRGTIGAVEDVTFEVGAGEAVGIVGESGSGKSVTALSVLRLVPVPGRIVAGSIRFRDEDVLALPPAALARLRRHDIAMVFQDASSFLNPVLRIGEQIGEAIASRELSGAALKRAVLDALRAVHIPDPERILASYPMQLSGGMQQRAVIATAVARKPALIIADEPTTALDATVQFQILRLLAELQTQLNMALVLISHDLGVIAGVCARVYVMYAGQIVESAPTAELYRAPAHPYTRALLGAILDPFEERATLTALPGAIPDAASPPPGCRFHPRCPDAIERCKREAPPLIEQAAGRAVRCWLHVA